MLRTAKNKNQKKGKTFLGFTLIEILVVISIISVLSSVVLSSTAQARARGRDGVRMSDIRQISNAINLYISNVGHAPFINTQSLSTNDPSCDKNNSSPACNTSDYCDPIQSGCDPDGVWPGWKLLEQALSPYIKLQKDPNHLVYSVPETQARYYYYYAPAGMNMANSGCGADSCSFMPVATSDSDFFIGANRLETRNAGFGILGNGTLTSGISSGL